MAKVGEVTGFAGSVIPTNYLLCDGSAYDSISNPEYQGLYAQIGNIWGGTDGTDFQVPDLRGRTLIGAGSGSGLTARTLGQTGGAETDPPRTSSDAGQRSAALSGDVLGVPPDIGPNSIDIYTNDANIVSGGENMQPFAVINYIICYQVTATDGQYEKVSEQLAATTLDGNLTQYSFLGASPLKSTLSFLLSGVAPVSVSPSSEVINFDFNNLLVRTFKTILSTEDVTTLSVTNGDNEVHLYWLLDVSGTCNITLPTQTEPLNENVLPDEVVYNDVSRILTITASQANQKYDLSRVKDTTVDPFQYRVVIQKTST